MRALSKIVRTICNLLFWFILIFGFYVIMHGHLTPGGGFQGGAVVASAFAMVFVAYGITKAVDLVKEGSFTAAESSGLLAFIGLAFLGIGTAFFYNFLAVGRSSLLPNLFSHTPHGINPGDLNTAGVLPLMSLAVGLEVIGGLGAVVYIMYLNRGGDEE